MEQDDGFHTMLGDVEELYHDYVDERGKTYADFWYWGQVLLAIVPFLLRSISWRILMFRENMKLSLRNILKYKGYSFINIFGLAVGLACTIIIILYVNIELSYDRYHPDADRIYRVAEHRIVPIGEFFLATTCPPLAPALIENFPQLEGSARFKKMPAGVIRNLDKKQLTQRVWCADQNSLDLFAINVLQGNPDKLLDRPGTIVLTQQMAESLFDRESPVGKIVEFTISQSNTRSDNTYELEVSGIIEDPPGNTHLKYGSLISYSSLDDIYYHYLNEWHTGGTYTYIKIASDSNFGEIEEGIRTIANNYVGDDFKRWGQTREYFLQPLTKIHLESDLRNEAEAPGNVLYIYIYSAIALLILLIGCMNFINLSSVRSVTRTREVGLRKVVGALRTQLVGQFLVESMLITIFSFSLAILLAYYMLPLFNNLAGTKLTLFSIDEPIVYYCFAGLILLVGLGSGSYPAFILTTFKPIMAIQGSTTPGSKGSLLLRFLVTGQFVISILLIICTMTVFKQLDYMQSSHPGFDKDHKIIIPFLSNSEYFKQHYETLKTEFLQHESVISVAASSSVPGQKPLTSGVRLRGEGHPWPEPGWQDPIQMNFLSIDEDFVPNYKIELLAGKTFSDERVDGSRSMLINEAAIERLGLSSPEEALGLELRESYYSRTKKIIGVTRNFHYEGLQKNVAPLLMEYSTSRFFNLTISIKAGDPTPTLRFIKQKWAEIFPEHVLYSSFLDEDFNKVYRYERQVSKTLGVVTLLGVLIACMGLLGLASFIAQRRKKEIGIRKIMGAGTFDIISLLSRQYLLLVALASILAIPLANFVMNRWLEDFAFRTELSVSVYILAIASALVLSLLTVIFQSLKAATANPVDELKEE